MFRNLTLVLLLLTTLPLSAAENVSAFGPVARANISAVGPVAIANVSAIGAVDNTAPACNTGNDSELVNHLTGSSIAGLSGTTWGAQQFSFAGNRTLTGVFIDLADTGSDVGNAVVSLYTDDGAGKPATQIANTEVSVATSTFPNTQTSVWFQFPQTYSYTASAVPHIVIRMSGGGTANIYYDTSTLYPGGTATSSSDSGSSWNAPSAAFDYNFSIWGCE